MNNAPPQPPRFLVGVSGRRNFHVLLAGLLAPILFVPLGALLAAYHCFYPGLDDEHRRWGRRISVLVTVDLLIALLAMGGHAQRLPSSHDPIAPRVTVGINFEPQGGPTRVVVGTTQPGSPADRAGVRPGDALLSLDGRPVTDRESFRRSITSGRSGVARTLRLRRAYAELDLTVVPDDRRRTARRPVALFDPLPGARASSSVPHRRELVGAGLGLAMLLGLLLAARRHGPAATRPVLATTLLLLGAAGASFVAEGVLLRTAGVSLGAAMIVSGLAPLALGLLAAAVRARLARQGLLAAEPPPTHSLGRGLALASWYLVAGALRIAALLPFAESVFKTRSEPGVIHELAASLDFTLGGAALGFVVVAIAAPVGEELLFRSLLLPGLLAWCSPAAATVSSAALFGALHVPQYGVGAVLVVLYGLVLGWLRLATGRLLAPVLLHIAINTMVFVVMAGRLMQQR